MSTKQIVQDLLEKLPEDISLHDVAQEIEFMAAVLSDNPFILCATRSPRHCPLHLFRLA
jgi:hypothetical protein